MAPYCRDQASGNSSTEMLDAWTYGLGFRDTAQNVRLRVRCTKTAIYSIKCTLDSEMYKNYSIRHKMYAMLSEHSINTAGVQCSLECDSSRTACP